MTAPKDAPLPIPAILVLALLSATAPLATDMYLPGFPLMASDLQASAAQIQITLTCFLIGLAAGQLVIGPLSDQFGRRRPLLIGTALAIVSGYLCTLAPDAGTLALLRVLQGFGGAAGVVIARAIIADRTKDAASAARLFQIMMMIGGLAPVLAPIVGTGIVAGFGWRAVFAVIASLSALAFLGVLSQLGETLPPERRNHGGLAALRAGVARVVGHRRYVGYALTVGFSFMAMFAYISASPFVYQGILGLTPLQYSIAFGVNAVGLVTVGAVSAKLVTHIPPQRLAATGLMTISLGAVATLICVLGDAPAPLMLPAIFLTVASQGLIFGNASALAISMVPRNAGTASAVLGALQFCLGALASPLVGLAGKDSALPMALVMLAAVGLALISFFVVAARGAEGPVEAGVA